MTLPPSATIAVFVLFGLFVAFAFGAFFYLMSRGQRVGSLRIVGRLGLDLAITTTTGSTMHVRITVKREAGEKVKIAVTVPVMVGLEWMRRADAMTLAQILETASSRLRSQRRPEALWPTRASASGSPPTNRGTRRRSRASPGR